MGKIIQDCKDAKYQQQNGIHPGDRTEVIKSNPGQIWMQGKGKKGRKMMRETMTNVGKK